MKWFLILIASLSLSSCYSSLPQHGGDGAADPAADAPRDDAHGADTVPVDPAVDLPVDMPWDPNPDLPPDIIWDHPIDPVGDACPPGLVLCAGVCVNIMTDPYNCGGCGNRCPDGSRCSGGSCIPLDPCDTITCEEPLICCYGACIDPTFDPYNCGACGRSCPWGSGDPAMDMEGCLEPSLGVYNLCCYGRCLPVADGSCGECMASCGPGSTCTGLWDAATAMCDFACMAPLSGATGSACESADDCTMLPEPQRQCMHYFFGYDFPGGYCTAECSSSSECGPGADCVDLIMARYCFMRCSGDDECRTDEGYICTEMPYLGGGPYCLPL